MTKGLPRSLAHANPMREAVTKIKLPIDHVISVTATGAAIGFGSVVLGGLPEAYLKVLSVAIQVQFTGPTSASLTDTFDGDFGVGTTPASDATITGSDVDLISSTALGAATAEVSPVKTVADGVDLVLDNTANDLEINLNLLIDAASITDDATVAITAKGVIEIVLVTMLDD